MSGQRIAIGLGLCVWVGLALAAPRGAEAADEAAKPQAADAAKPAAEDAMLSLVTAAPPLLGAAERYPKYYGDPYLDAATIDGNLLDRQYLLGSLKGTRDDLARHGVFLNIGLTQVMQVSVAGDADNDVSYVGSADLWAALDTGRLGWWPGGLIYAHVEGDWGDPLSGTGALLPPNDDAISPGAPTVGALSELYIVQGLSEQVLVILGKGDWASYADVTFFANNERTQFLNVGLVNNPILAAFVPYTSLGAMASVNVTKTFVLAGGLIQNASNATRAGFDELSMDKLTMVGVVTWTPTFGDLPGNYAVMLGYTTKDPRAFDIDRRYLLGEIIGLNPTIKKDGNYALALTASQYLWVADEGHSSRRDGKPTGLGLFLRFGIAPEDRNVIDQFYSVGVGGYGGPFGRVNDNWGVGWGGSHISGDFRRLTTSPAGQIDDFEHVVEGFYNIELTPAVYLTLDLQYIATAGPRKDDAVLFGTRVQVDF